MAPYIFLRSVLAEKPIHVFNHGKLERDFTYIDDIVKGLMCLLEHPSENVVPHSVYNIGHSHPVRLLDFIRIIEQTTGHKAILHMEEMQSGDVYRTCADTSHLQADFNYQPMATIEEGLHRFYKWYKNFYKENK